MKVRSFLALCAVTLAVVIAAAVTIVRDPRLNTGVGAAERLFPELLDKTDTLAVITLRDTDTTLTIQKSDAGWGLMERDGYPVRPDAVRGLVLKLANLEKVEAKTERAELYSRLGVEDTATSGAQSKEVELLDDEGAVLARLLVGKAAFGVGEEGGLYVRKPDERRSWLVRGRLAPGIEARDWVERRIVDIPAIDVRSVRVVHPDGETIHAAKRTIEDDLFVLEGLDGETPPQSIDALDALATVLSGLNLEDLKKSDDIPFADAATMHAIVTTFDGLEVTVDLAEHNGEDWIRVGAEGGQGAGTVREIVHRTKGWAYQVPSFVVAPWKKRMADLLAPEAASGS